MTSSLPSKANIVNDDSDVIDSIGENIILGEEDDDGIELSEEEHSSFVSAQAASEVGGAGVSENGVEFSSKSGAGRVPPSSIDSEQSVIGSVLLDNESLTQVEELLSANDFYKKSHQDIWDAVMELSERREPIDVVTLASALRESNKAEGVGGIEYLSYLVDAVPTAANTLYYAKIIKEMSLRRRLIHEAGAIAEEAMNERGDIDGFIDSVEQRILKVAEKRLKTGFSPVGDIVKDSIKHVEYLYVNKGKITGSPSGFVDLDKMTNGFQPSDLVIIAGRPAMGKTSFALSMARHMALDEGGRVAFFSLEMSKQQIVLRLLCSEARVSNSKVRSGHLGESDFPKLVDAASKIAQAELFIDDTAAISVMEMRAKARRLHKEKPLTAIFVDYLQLMRGSKRTSERREQEIAEISASLKALAKELSVPVLALSQLNRAVEARTDKRPMMSDLRESGAIEQDADIIGFVYRDEVYNPDTPEKGIAEFIVSKHRSGEIGRVRLGFQGEFTLFVDLDESEADEEFDYLGQDIEITDDDDLI